MDSANTDNTIANSSTNPLQWDKILPDILGFLLYYFLFDRLLAWQLMHPGLSCTILMVLNIGAVCIATLFFFTAYQNDNSLKKMISSLTKAEAGALGISVFISSFAFCWWLVPFTAVKSMGVKETGFILGAGAYFITYMAMVANGVNPLNKKSLADKKLLQLLSPVIVTLFFFFSYAFLIMSLQHWHPSFAGARLLGAVCLIVFYLPLRFFLLLKPPTARVEYFFFLLSFTWMMYQLFIKL